MRLDKADNNTSDTEPNYLNHRSGRRKQFHTLNTVIMLAIGFVFCASVDCCIDISKEGMYEFNTPRVAMLEEGEAVIPVIIDLVSTCKICDKMVHNVDLDNMFDSEPVPA